MKIDLITRAFYAGKDAVRGDRNPYAEGSAAWHAWRHGYETEHGARIPLSAEQVARRFAALNRGST